MNILSYLGSYHILQYHVKAEYADFSVFKVDIYLKHLKRMKNTSGTIFKNVWPYIDSL